MGKLGRGPSSSSSEMRPRCANAAIASKTRAARAIALGIKLLPGRGGSGRVLFQEFQQCRIEHFGRLDVWDVAEAGKQREFRAGEGVGDVLGAFREVGRVFG